MAKKEFTVAVRCSEILECDDVSHALSRRLRLKVLWTGSPEGVAGHVREIVQQYVYPSLWRRLFYCARYDIIFLFVYRTYQDYGDNNSYTRARWVKPGFIAPDGWGGEPDEHGIALIMNDLYEARHVG
jgi:hypothetical protein